MAYAMRSDQHQRRYTTLKLETLTALAKAVNASPDETSELILLGLKQHAHPTLRKYIAALERDNLKMRMKLNRGPKNYRPV